MLSAEGARSQRLRVMYAQYDPYSDPSKKLELKVGPSLSRAAPK